MRDYYSVIFRNDKDSYCIWYSDKQDGLICLDGELLKFESLEHLIDYADTSAVEIKEEPTLYDLALIRSILEKEEITNFRSLIDFWNISSDAKRSLGE